MKIPGTVIIIGRVESFSFLKTKGKRATTRSLIDEGRDYLLATNRTHTALYLFENKQGNSGEGPATRTEIKYRVPALRLKKIGTAVSIQYWSDQWEEEERLYKHVFKSASLYAEKYTRFELIGITPGNGKIIDDNGIRS